MSTRATRLANLSAEQRKLLARQLVSKKQAERIPAPIQPFPRTGNQVPLSFAQRRFWFLERFTPGNPVYTMSGVARLTFPLQGAVLERCFTEIIRRHETLRTTFHLVEDEPVGVIAPPEPTTLHIEDLRAVPAPERQGHARSLLDQEARRPFDLTQGPLLRVLLLRLGEQDYLVQLTMHHIVGDGWSTRVLFQEIGALYWAFLANQSSPLPELPFQYADFAQWQQHWLQGERLQGLLTFWTQHLVAAPTVLDLPTDHPRPAIQSFQGARAAIRLDPELVGALKGVVQAHGATLFMGLLTAFQGLLSRSTGQDDLLIGVPITNRTQAGTEALIGVFVNTLVVRTDLSGQPSFLHLLEQVRRVTLDAYAHQDLPFEMLVEQLHLERDLSRSSLVQALFNYEVSATQEVHIPGLTLEDLGNGTAKFDLMLSLQEQGGEVSGHLEYSRDLFEAETIERFIGHYQVLLRAIVAHPEQELARLPLLTEPERQQQLVTWNATQVAYPRCCIHQLFEEQVRATPAAVALIFANQLLTYQQVNERANQLAHRLQRLGVGPEVLVGVCMERSLEMVVSVLAILKAGGACVPLDPTYPKERLAYMLNDAQVPVLLTQEPLLVDLPAHNAHLLCVDTDLTIAQEKITDVVTTALIDNTAYVLYTSGSTGLPKGVVLPHRGIIRLVKGTSYIQFTAEEIFLQFAPISFDASLFELWGSLLHGAQLVIFPPHIPSLDELAKFLVQHRISTLWLTAGLFHQMVERHAQTLGRIHQVLAGGDVLSVPHVQHVLEAVEKEQGTLVNGYGPTESTTFATCYPMKTMNDVGSSVSIGKPIANTSVYVLDRYLQLVPIGVAGELYIGGDGLAREYLHRAELTAEKFLAHPFSPDPEARLYKTGDRVRFLPDGNLQFLGRLDHQIKLRGFRIELGEIETVLRQHLQVQECVVIVHEDTPTEKRLIAYLVLASSQDSVPTDLRTFLKERLPEYMVPSALVVLQTIPLTSNGKLDRRALPAPQTIRSAQEQPLVAAQTTTERDLVTIWQQVLEVTPIGVLDNFFDIGGHSLLATRLIARIHDALHVEVPLPLLFQKPTIRDMAQAINLLRAEGVAALEHLYASFDLAAEVQLDPLIRRESTLPQRQSAQAHRLLLTGASGFLGAFLLQELLRQTDAVIYCLVRAPDQERASLRLEQNLASYGLWQPDWRQRIVPVVGNLAHPQRLGLSPSAFDELAESVEVIYHNGALVNFLRSYEALKATNVLGTQEILHLASTRSIKPVHHVSSTYVFSRAEYAPETVLNEQDPPKHTTRSTLGYTQSKWVGEQLMLEAGRRGLPISIYRVGRVGGQSQTGACQLNDLLWKFIQVSVQVQAAPALELTVELSPVDYISSALVYLSRQPEQQGKIFHLFNPQEVRASDLVEWMRPYGYALPLLAYPQWCEQVRRFAGQHPESAAASLVPLLSEALPLDRLPNLHLGLRNTIEGLAGSQIVCPPLDARLLSTYFAYFASRGYFDTPTTA